MTAGSFDVDHCLKAAEQCALALGDLKTGFQSLPPIEVWSVNGTQIGPPGPLVFPDKFKELCQKGLVEALSSADPVELVDRFRTMPLERLQALWRPVVDSPYWELLEPLRDSAPEVFAAWPRIVGERVRDEVFAKESAAEKGSTEGTLGL